MAQHIDNVNDNVWWDGVTLTNCTHCRVGEGTTGTITNTDYAQIGMNNSVTISDCQYLEIADGNTNIVLTNADYIIIGYNNRGVTLGSHTSTQFAGRTGANSMTISSNNIGITATGKCLDVNDSRYCEVGACFNEINNSNSVVLDNANGNKIENSMIVDLTETNNNQISADSIQLVEREAFMDYSQFDKVVRAQPIVRPIERQSDSVGMILDTQANRLINSSDEKGISTGYTLVGGVWSKTQ